MDVFQIYLLSLPAGVIVGMIIGLFINEPWKKK